MDKARWNHKTSTPWDGLRSSELLQLPLRKLFIPLRQSRVAPLIDQLKMELKSKGFLHFSPLVWFSDEWFTPDGHCGLAVPFYLSHPRLTQLQQRYVGKAEGASPQNFIKLLRHECGHAFENAYGTRRLKRRQELFGTGKDRPYHNYYKPRKACRNFVRHLDDSYAQSHPDEDFAETFAVWLNPASRWRTSYSHKALEKLMYIDELALKFGDQKPPYGSRRSVDSQTSLSVKLSTHFQARKSYYQKSGNLIAR